MAKHSYERARWKAQEAHRRYEAGSPRLRYRYRGRRPSRQEALERIGHDLNSSVHGDLSRFTRSYRRMWRRAGRRIGRLHTLGDEWAESLIRSRIVWA